MVAWEEEEELLDADEATERARLLPDGLKRMLLTGASALFMTEDGIRSVVSDMKLPKDAVKLLMQQAEKTRRDVFGAFSDEIKGFLRSVDLHGELRKALHGMKIEVIAELRFVDDSGNLKMSATKSTGKEESASTKGKKKTTSKKRSSSS